MVHLRDLFCVEQIGAIKKIEFEENLQKQVRLFSELVYQTSCFYEFRNEANISSYFKIMYSLVRDFIKNWDSCGKEFFKKHNLELFSFVTNLLNRACIRQEIDLMEYHAKLKSLEVLFLNEMGKN